MLEIDFDQEVELPNGLALRLIELVNSIVIGEIIEDKSEEQESIPMQID